MRDDKYNFERIIPLYGFRTRRNDTSFFIGLNFAYISVDPVDYIYPPANFCCVLRIDPCEYTVSVLQEIIKTDDVIGVVSRNTIDIALYSGQENGTTFFKIYFSQVYVALNQTKKNSSVEDEEIQVVFYSQFYNFASMFSTTITFNFTIYNLSIKNGSGLVFDEIVLS